MALLAENCCFLEACNVMNFEDDAKTGGNQRKPAERSVALLTGGL
jgi:hypothetical protein